MSQLHAAQVEAILAHELAHVRRHDYFVNLMQTVAETLLFYHPAVWWLSKRIRDEREHCCDDVAVAACGDAVSYVAALTELETWRGDAPALGTAALGGSLLNRARRILDFDTPKPSHAPGGMMTLLLVTCVCVTATLLAQTEKPAENLKFEVASVRPNTSGTDNVNLGMHPGGRFTAVNVPLAMLIRNAYQLQNFQLIGDSGVGDYRAL